MKRVNAVIKLGDRKREIAERKKKKERKERKKKIKSGNKRERKSEGDGKREQAIDIEEIKMLERESKREQQKEREGGMKNSFLKSNKCTFFHFINNIIWHSGSKIEEFTVFPRLYDACMH